MTKENVKDWLLKQRISNYGYDWKWFGKMTRKKAQLKAKIRNMSDADVRRSLAKAGILGSGRRLERKRGRVDYTTGQSFNEELLNMLQLSASKGKKSFWEVQDRWMP
jgi:hypothetical protein